MILRKTPSVFLRTLRAISPDALPALPAQKLSAAQAKRLENTVFSRIAAEQNTSVFAMTDDNDGYDRFDAPNESTPIGGRDAWKGILKIAATACLCFALLASIVIVGGRLARLTGTGQTTDTADNPHISGTEAIWREPQETGIPYPRESAEGFRLDVIEAEPNIGNLTLSLQLRTAEPISGVCVQYRRAILYFCNPETDGFDIIYDMRTQNQPLLEVLAGDLHFPLVGMGETTILPTEITFSCDLRGYDGVFYVVLEGLTLVREANAETEPDAEYGLVTEVLTDGAVLCGFHLLPDVPSDDAATEEIPPRNTTTGPPESAFAPLYPTAEYALTLKNNVITDDVVTLGLRLESPLPLTDDSYAVYFQYCDIDLWNHEAQIWENKYGTNDADADFVKMLIAGDVQFLVEDDRYVEASLPYFLPDDGWYRITLRGLVLVREAREGEDADYHIVTETLDDYAVYAVFHKD